DWGLGIGDWGLGIGDWEKPSGLSSRAKRGICLPHPKERSLASLGMTALDGCFPNPESRIPNPDPNPYGISLRDPNACDSVPRSTYSSSPPSGTPWARRLGRTPWLRASWAR